MAECLTLYEINDQLALAMARAEEYAEANGGELSEQLGAELDKLEMARAEKIGNICRYIKTLRAQASAIGDEASALRQRQASKVNRADSLEQYLAAMLHGERYEDSTSVVAWRLSTHVEVDSLACVPEQYQRVVPETKEPDKKALAAALKAGEEYAGVRLVMVNNIQVK